MDLDGVNNGVNTKLGQEPDAKTFVFRHVIVDLYLNESWRPLVTPGGLRKLDNHVVLMLS